MFGLILRKYAPSDTYQVTLITPSLDKLSIGSAAVVANSMSVSLTLALLASVCGSVHLCLSCIVSVAGGSMLPT